MIGPRTRHAAFATGRAPFKWSVSRLARKLAEVGGLLGPLACVPWNSRKRIVEHLELRLDVPTANLPFVN
jgi:hypothetical protein